MDELLIFSKSEVGDVRTVCIGGESWFVAKDVATILGYGVENKQSKALANSVKYYVEEEDRMTVSAKVFKEQDPELFSPVRNYGMVAVNESGLYALIVGSHQPEAQKFKRRITFDVLPSIRKHGVFVVEELLQNPDTVIVDLTNLKEERAKNQLLVQELSAKEDEILVLEPKADYYDKVLASTDAIAATVIAKDYGWSANRLPSGNWVLYQNYAGLGYMKTQTSTQEDSKGQERVFTYTRWTQVGRKFIYETLKKDGILPLSEVSSNEYTEAIKAKKRMTSTKKCVWKWILLCPKSQRWFCEI